MTKLQTLAAVLLWTLAASPLLFAGDLSQYREFELDSNLTELARQAGTEPEQAKTIHERPALIQRLSWRAGFDDPVKEVLFSFYDGELFQMIVNYDSFNTEGLTAHDLIEATSQIYGEALRPTAEISLRTNYGGNETVEVIARWEDADWSFNLVRFKYQSSFTLAVFSKHLAAQAREAINEAILLDKQEAPQRKIDERKKEDAVRAAELEETRLVNRLRFQP
jgi:hypothetical protein